MVVTGKRLLLPSFFRYSFTPEGRRHLTPWGSETAVRIDTVDDIANFGKSLGKDDQLFLTSEEAISGLDLTNPVDLAKAEEILGLPSGRLTNSSGVVLTEVNITNLEYLLPTSGNEFFIPGGMTSGGAPEIVIKPINVFSDPSVESLQFFYRK